jgi:predicted transcriptional regulator
MLLTTHKLLIRDLFFLYSGSSMRRSKLEMYVDILKVLAQRGPLQITHIMSQANVNCNILKERLEFLVKQGLINEIVMEKNNIVYANTDRGIAVIKFFGDLAKTIPDTEEDGKFLPFPN